MTIRAYITDKLKAFGVSEAQLVDFSISSGLNLDKEFDSPDTKKVGVGLVQTIEELVLAPKMSNVSEAGFSMSWDFSSLGQYYIWLCRKWGVSPNADVLALMGISTILDKSNKW